MNVIEGVPIHKIEVLVAIPATDIKSGHAVVSYRHTGHLLQCFDHVAFSQQRRNFFQSGGAKAYFPCLSMEQKIVPVPLYHHFFQ